MKKNIIRIILILLLLGTFSIIFVFSSQDHEESAGFSEKITIAITSKIKLIQEKPEWEKDQILERFESVLKKVAHFSIYTVVGILLMLLLETYPLKTMDQIAASLLIGVIYAASDEIHQAFIPRKRAYGTRRHIR